MEDDRQLATRAAQGDGSAFELLVHRHTPAVWRLARSLVGDDGVAEEVVQDTFLKAHRGLANFRGESAVSTWLHAICHRTSLDRMRRRDLNVVPLEHARRRPACGAVPDDRLVLEEALGELPDDERAAFIVVAVLGFPSEEAAAVLEAPASTVRSRVARARRRLADRLLGGAAMEEMA